MNPVEAKVKGKVVVVAAAVTVIEGDRGDRDSSTFSGWEAPGRQQSSSPIQFVLPAASHRIASPIQFIISNSRSPRHPAAATTRAKIASPTLINRTRLFRHDATLLLSRSLNPSHSHAAGCLLFPSVPSVDPSSHRPKATAAPQQQSDGAQQFSWELFSSSSFQ